MKKKILFIFAFIALASGAYFAATNKEAFPNKSIPAGSAVVSQSQPEAIKPDIAANDSLSNAVSSSSRQQVQNSIVQPVNVKSEIPASASSVPVMHIVFSAGPNSYSADVKSGSTVYDAMLALASSTNFAFKSQYYSGLGYFINEINSQPNGGGTYWTLYVNGKYSNVGASQYKLQPGDSVEWKYEKQ